MDPMSVSEGERVTLRCRTQCTIGLNPTYIWYKNGQSLTKPITSYNSLILDPVSSEDAGNYSCAVEGLERILSPEETLTSYTWYKKNGGHYQFSYGITGPHLVFNQIKSSVTGEYYCEAWNGIKTGSSDANPPVDKYTWYKKNVASPKASGQSYSITNIISEDRGEYYCEAQNGRGSMNSTALMIIVAGKQTSVVTAAVGIIVVVLVLILCFSGFMCFRRSTGGSDATADTQSDHPDCNSDTYTALNMRTMSPDYDTLISVHPDPNSDTYTPLNMKTRSPEYDTLANVRGISH
ncbi:B-cell receptor CD22-like [Oncorhynchus mykiss]|uniref:B-cell receptor CD22-like n=1 Tax=Oncorhynchus mykiss TaxID=8022 RepID=UPI001877ABD7|nr:B-cell receptor CD22-like [Oncorhynchus mykiss]